MGRLLPDTVDVNADRADDPRLLCLEDERTTEVFDALSSTTGRAVFRALNEEPRPAKDLAAELDLSVQNVVYHLDNLEETGLIEVLDTCYSEKGHEMDIYGPSEEPFVLFLGLSNDRPGVTAAFKRFAGAIGPTAILLAAGQALARLFDAGDR
jgi:DNA-binding transcriptional ArsR family regulator